MHTYRKGSHCVYDLRCHVVWITKYRYPVLTGDVALRLRTLIREICAAHEVKIEKGHVSKDHIHLLVSLPPNLAPAKFLMYVKGKTSRKLQMEFRALRKRYWGRHLWARGYFCASVGVITDEMVKEYIENQDIEAEDDGFKIGDEKA